MISASKSRRFAAWAALCGSLCLLGPSAASAAADEDFPEPRELSSAVSFWTRVYLDATTRGGLLHDSLHLGVVYEKLDFEGIESRRARQRHVDARKRHWRSVLRRLARGGAATTREERLAAELLARELDRKPTAGDFGRATQRLRFQLGQRDRFRAGLIRSGAYEPEMRAVFRDKGLPEDLAYLPHVESSFDVHAYSKYGAAGVWQFVRSTGRRYLTIDYVIDERLDPMRATRAAAELLEDNYQSLGTWPLALTAYNHGAAGMRRAKRRLGTDRIETIVAKYKSRTFGFASRNFYAQFLAARRIARSAETHFGPLQRDPPLAVDELRLPFFVAVPDLHRHLGVSPETIRALNPGLRPSVFRAGKRIPRGYTLRLPAGTVGADGQAWLAKIPANKRYSEQHRSSYHVVQRGETLSRIAQRHRTRTSTLVALNNLPSRHLIYPGQVLQLPDLEGAARTSPRGLVRSAQAAAARPPGGAESAPKPPVPKRAPGSEPAAAKRASPEARPPALGPDSPFRRVRGNRILVDADETLGDYAEWLGLSPQQLRRLNGLNRGRPLHIGQTIELDFSRVSPDRFLQRRLEYHKGIEEDFFGSFRITGTVEHRIERGENLWALSHRVYEVPTWLIRRYNPDVDLRRLVPGTRLRIPLAEKLS